jgi:Flp pilus assembly protein TadG
MTVENPTSVTIMLYASINGRIRAAASRFAKANQGNIAVIFAIALVPLLSFVGAAIDYSRANAARSAMQAALDSTALMVSKDLTDGIITPDQINTKAQLYFTALYTNKDAQSVTVSATYTASTSMGSTVQITGSGSVVTDFMKVAGFPNLGFNTNSTSAWGNVRMRVAMVLDNTGSMAQNGKIGALQTASKNLIDQLSALARNQGDVYISIIPFAKTVNVGSSNSGQSWIDWSDWQNPPTQQQQAYTNPPSPAVPVTVSLPNNWSSIGPGSTCPFPNSGKNANFSCTTSPVNGSATTTKIPSSGTYKGYICPGVDSLSHSLYNGCWNSVSLGNGQYSHTWIANAQSTWTGCITDRTPQYDVQNDAPTTATPATLFPANQYYENSTSYCKSGSSPALQPIMPLSYDWAGLKSTITAMQPTGGTNQAVGLAWGWHSLNQGAPLNAPAEDPNYTYKKAIILLSDGLNTEDRWPVNGDGSTQNTSSANSQFPGLIDARQQILCDNIKNQGITIYTIQVNTSTPADATSSILQYCASKPENFYLLYSASQVISAFNSIGTSLSKLRVAR